MKNRKEIVRRLRERLCLPGSISDDEVISQTKDSWSRVMIDLDIATKELCDAIKESLKEDIAKIKVLFK